VRRISEAEAFVFLVEAVHRPPRQRDLVTQDGCVVGERDVLPGAASSSARASDDLEPGGLAEVGVLAAVVGRPEHTVGDVADREVRDGVAPRLEEQDGVVALDYGAAAEHGAHPAPQRLGVQHSLRHSGRQEPPVGVAT
jgi:hypothetical protein